MIASAFTVDYNNNPDCIYQDCTRPYLDNLSRQDKFRIKKQSSIHPGAAMKLFLFFLLISITLSANSCQTTKKSGLSDKTFVSVLSELMIIESLNIPAELKPQMVRDVLQFYSVDSSAFNQKIKELSEEPGKWEILFGKTQKNIGKLSYPAYYFSSPDSLRP